MAKSRSIILGTARRANGGACETAEPIESQLVLVLLTSSSSSSESMLYIEPRGAMGVRQSEEHPGRDSPASRMRHQAFRTRTKWRQLDRNEGSREGDARIGTKAGVGHEMVDLEVRGDTPSSCALTVDLGSGL